MRKLFTLIFALALIFTFTGMATADTSTVDVYASGGISDHGMYFGSIDGYGYGSSEAEGCGIGIGWRRSYAEGEAWADGNTHGFGLAFDFDFFGNGFGLMVGGQETWVDSEALVEAGPLGFTSAHVEGLASQWVEGGIGAGDSNNGFYVGGSEYSEASYSATDIDILFFPDSDAYGQANAEGSIYGIGSYRTGDSAYASGFVGGDSDAYGSCLLTQTHIQGEGSLGTGAAVNNGVAYAGASTDGSYGYSGTDSGFGSSYISGGGYTTGCSTAEVNNTALGASYSAYSSASSASHSGSSPR